MLGAGEVVRLRAASALSRTEGGLSAIWSPNGGAHRLPDPFCGLASPSIEEVIERSDAIYIASPPQSHVALALMAVNAGRHVLVEKPLTAGLADTSVLERAAALARVQVETVFYRRLAPWFLRVRRTLASGRLGRLRAIDWRFSTPYDGVTGGPRSWRLDPAQSGGGVLADAGCHRLDLVLELMGAPQSIACLGAEVVAPGIETDVELRLDWKSGGWAACRFSWKDPAEDRLTMVFDHGRMVVDQPDRGGVQLIKGERVQDFMLAPEANPLEAFIRRFEARLATPELWVDRLKADLMSDRVLASILAMAHASVPDLNSTVSSVAGHVS